ncbi:hypothetical protein KBX50_04640 [Micromonospora sp. C51]|uniref:hypothetical protein n=1 Tax=Micromonospora sp. C51 TaxID=2824879 RepID=UPI001B37B406|nr:hypothetical protein [Micromonospora sp. C51]MBQ1047776.1 hypothetical protein [Micromonospora sp. C51]
MNEPRYGYGRGERPLWSPRDRAAEDIRRVLRRAGFRDFSEQHLDGFAVEGANTSQDGPEEFSVAYCGTSNSDPLHRYRELLERAGYQVDPDPQDAHLLLVRRRPAKSTPATAGPDRALAPAAVCAALATIALVASWMGSGHVRLAGGIGSAVLGVLAVFLAALWYRRRLDEQM